MWSLDGALRYIPLAALHDGREYLVEKYRNIVFTLYPPLLLGALHPNR
jgi:CHAT domain-containing protein